MTHLHAAIDWKFGIRSGVRVVNDKLVEFPGKMPSKKLQSEWVAEYEKYLATAPEPLSLSGLRDAMVKKGLISSDEFRG